MLDPVETTPPKLPKRERQLTFEDVEDAISRIQRQARVFLNYRRFRQFLYRLILLRNILISKVYKE